MADNELKIGVGIDGLPKAEGDLQQLATAEESVGVAGSSAGDASAKGHDKAIAKAGEHKDAENKAGQAAEKVGDKAKAAGTEAAGGHEKAKAKAKEHEAEEKKVGNAATAAGKKGKAAGDEAASGHEKGKNKAKEHKGQVGPLGGIYENLKSGVIGWIGGFAGFQTVMQLVDDYIQHLEKVREAMRKIVEESQGTTGGVHQLAVQLGDVSETGFKRAQMIAGQVGEAGGFDLETANQFAISMDVALGKRGGIKANMGIAKEIAGVAGALNLKSDEAGKLVELLDTAGALESPEKTKEAIAKLRAAFTQSRSTSFGAFATMMQKGGTGMLTDGMSLDQVLEYAVQTRQVSASEDLAATAMEQLGRVAEGSGATGKFLKAQAASKGLNFDTMKKPQRTAFVQQLFREAKTPEQQEALKNAIPPEVYGTLKKAFSETNIQATSSAGEAVAAASSADVDNLTQGYQKTEYYQERRSNLKRQLAKSSAVTTPQKAYERMLKDAEADYDVALANGYVPAGVSKEAWAEDQVLQTMRTDVRKRMSKAERQGDVRAQVELSRTAEKLNSPGAWNGRFGGFDDETMQDMAASYQKSQNVTINNYYGQTGGQVVNLNQKTPDVRNGPGVSRIGQGDSGVGSR